jgi:hypothetical protein
MESDKMNGIEISCVSHGNLTLAEIITPFGWPIWIRCRNDNLNALIYVRSNDSFPLFNANFQVCPGDAMTIKSESGLVRVEHGEKCIFKLWYNDFVEEWERQV